MTNKILLGFKFEFPQFLWGKTLNNLGRESGYGVVAGTEGNSKEWYEALRSNENLIGQPSLASEPVSAYTLTYSSSSAYLIWSHFFYQKGMKWEQLNHRAFLSEHHVIIDKQYLPIIRFDLRCLEQLEGVPNIDEVYWNYTELGTATLVLPTQDQIDKNIENALQILSDDGKVGVLTRAILDSICNGSELNTVTHTECTIEDRFSIICSVAALLPSKYIGDFAFSTHSYYEAPDSIFKIRFVEANIPISVKKGASFDYRWPEEQIRQIRPTYSKVILDLHVGERRAGDTIQLLHKTVLSNDEEGDELQKLYDVWEISSLELKIRKGEGTNDDLVRLINRFPKSERGRYILDFQDRIYQLFDESLVDNHARQALFSLVSGSLESLLEADFGEILLRSLNAFEDNEELPLIILDAVRKIDRLKPKAHLLFQEWLVSLANRSQAKFINWLNILHNRNYIDTDYKLRFIGNQLQINYSDDLLLVAIETMANASYSHDLVRFSSDNTLLSSVYTFLLNDTPNDPKEVYQLYFPPKNWVSLTLLAIKYEKFNFLTPQWISRVFYEMVHRKDDWQQILGEWKRTKKTKHAIPAFAALSYCCSDQNFRPLDYWDKNELFQNKSTFIDFLAGVMTAAKILHLGDQNYRFQILFTQFAAINKTGIEDWLNAMEGIEFADSRLWLVSQVITEHVTKGAINYFENDLQLLKYVQAPKFNQQVVSYACKLAFENIQKTPAEWLLGVLSKIPVINSSSQEGLYTYLSHCIDDTPINDSIIIALHRETLKLLSNKPTLRLAYLKGISTKRYKILNIDWNMFLEYDKEHLLNSLEYFITNENLNAIDLGDLVSAIIKSRNDYAELVISKFKVFNPPSAIYLIQLRHRLISTGLGDFSNDLTRAVILGKCQISKQLRTEYISLLLKEFQGGLELIENITSSADERFIDKTYIRELLQTTKTVSPALRKLKKDFKKKA